MDLSKVVDWLKLSPKYLFALFFAGAFILFADDNLLKQTGLIELRDSYRPWVGGMTLLCAALLFSNLADAVKDYLTGKAKSRRKLKLMQHDLHSLTPAEKVVLRGYIHGNTKTQNFGLDNGVIGDLQARQILYRAANAGYALEFAFNIQPWAWEYLRQHPDLLDDEK